LITSKHKWVLVFLVSLLLIQFYGVTNSNVSADSNSEDWPMFRHDPSHSGASSGSPALYPRPLWNYTPNTSNESWYDAPPGNTFADGWSSPAVVNGVVYIGESGYYTELNGHRIDLVLWGGVFAFNASSGDKLWNYSINDDVVSSPAVVNGVVYFGLYGIVQALNATNGAKLWNCTVGWVKSSPAVVNGVVYVGSSYDNGVYALNATNGNKLWNYSTGDIVVSSPAVVNGVVYVGSNDHNVYALNATNGNKLWNYSTDGMVLASPAVVGGIVYISSYGNGVYALNATNGNRLWNYTTANGQSSPAVANGVVYMGFDDGNFYALNATNGDKLWNYTTGSGYSSPAVVGGVVYFGSGDSLYALNAASGDKLWNYTGGGASPVVVDGVVYFGLGSRVYALGEPYSTTPPKISVLSPLSQQYNESSVSLVFTVDKPVNWTGYSLNGAENVSITENTTLTWLSNGLHNVTVYAEDLFGNVGASETVFFAAEPFPILPVAAASVAAVVAGIVLLLVFRKRRREAAHA
jgi:outer membrane protein assembly factor BamB